MWLRFWPGKLCHPTPGAQPGLWSLAPPMPTGRSEIAASKDGGKIYVSGGIGLRGSLDNFEAYDTLRGQWKALAPLPTPLHHHGLVVSGGLIYAAGGYVDLSMTPTAAAWVYDPKTNAWRSIAPLPNLRRLAIWRGEIYGRKVHPKYGAIKSASDEGADSSGLLTSRHRVFKPKDQLNVK